MKLAYVIIGAIVLVGLAGAGGFYGGMTYAGQQQQAALANFARQRGIQTQPNGTAQTNPNAANNPCGFGGQFPGGAQGAQPPIGTTTDPNAQTGQRRQGGQFGGFGGFNGAQLGNCVARGEIKSVNGDRVEISTAESVVTVKVNDTTAITMTQSGTANDLKVGDRVTVFSTETGTNPTASGIQLTRTTQ